jgi:hypothetical protein
MATDEGVTFSCRTNFHDKCRGSVTLGHSVMRCVCDCHPSPRTQPRSALSEEAEALIRGDEDRLPYGG